PANVPFPVHIISQVLDNIIISTTQYAGLTYTAAPEKGQAFHYLPSQQIQTGHMNNNAHFLLPEIMLVWTLQSSRIYISMTSENWLDKSSIIDAYGGFKPLIIMF
ncbi:hypothetical protein ACJX0J_014170, partial [Zea mays]